MLSWPLFRRNMVEDSKVSVPVALYAQLENGKTLAQKVRYSQSTLMLITDAAIASRPLGNFRNCLSYSEEDEIGAYSHHFPCRDLLELWIVGG